MRSPKRALLYGFLVWLVPFLVSFVVFPFRASDRPLFESIMAVVLTVSVAVFGVLYMRRPAARPLREGILVGLLWLAISLAIDLLLFLPDSPMHMSLGTTLPTSV